MLHLQVDLAEQPFRRREMLSRSNLFDTLPQLHAYGKVRRTAQVSGS